jgi:hypothetical protein
MNINDLINIMEEFLSIINPNFCEDYDYENSELDLWKLLHYLFN